MSKIYELSLLYSSIYTFMSGLFTVVTMDRPYRARWAFKGEYFQILGVALLAALPCLIWFRPDEIAPLAVMLFIASYAAHRLLPQLSAAGVVYAVAAPFSAISGGLWMFFWLRTAGYHPVVAGVFPLLFALNLCRMLVVLTIRIGTFSLLTRKIWKRPVRPRLPASTADALPLVSIHIPAHAEPPEIVIATLESVARLDYPNFEVLVCDNNTEDESLWKPVEAWCERMNGRSGGVKFHFHHVMGLTGAKAGALNYCLDSTDPSAELVAVIDADYMVEPDFLSKLTGFFQEPNFAFVQTSHDYRSNDASLFNRACYWEYVTPNRLEYAGASEMQASFTVGTMCIFRRHALEQVGRWAEWCQTEDSEIAIRLRAAGFDGIFLPYTFGRGLMPDNFADWKRQRFRWTSGPMQQFRRHWRLFMPLCLGGSLHLTPWGKTFEVFRSLAPLTITFGILSTSAFAISYPLLVHHGYLPNLTVPTLAAVAFLLVNLQAFLRAFSEYWVCGCRRIGNMLAAEMAALALGHVCGAAAITAAIGARIPWLRTPKFSRGPDWRSALCGARTEILCLVLLLLASGAALLYAPSLMVADILVVVLALAYPVMSFAAAPVIAILPLLGKGPDDQSQFIDGRVFDLPGHE